MSPAEYIDYKRGFNEGLADGMKCQRKSFRYFNSVKEQGYSDGFNCAQKGGGKNPARFMRIKPPMVLRMKKAAQKLNKTI